MESEISVYFTLTGLDCEPEEITAKIGIKPTKTWKVGDLINSRGTIRRKHNGWKLESKLEKSAELEEQIKSVLEQLQPSWQPLREICTQYDAEINCVIYTIKQIPAIHFDREIIEKVNQLNAAIDVDLYVLPDGET